MVRIFREDELRVKVDDGNGIFTPDNSTHNTELFLCFHS